MAIAGYALSVVHPGYVFRPNEYINHESSQMIAEDRWAKAYN